MILEPIEGMRSEKVELPLSSAFLPGRPFILVSDVRMLMATAEWDLSVRTLRPPSY
jgi:hypothetical protein